jgi:FKBP-type peptidyl-prolyl cis-trans isomerase SlyD
MQIARNRVVSLDVELSDIWGNLIDHPEQPVQYLHGDYGDIFALVEAALEGKNPNDRIDVRLEPEDSYGDYDENLLKVEPLSGFPEGLEVGMRIATESLAGGMDDGSGQRRDDGDDQDDADDDHEGKHGHSHDRAPLFYTVTDIAQGTVVLDGNHPLAGIALRFVATVVDVRPATQAEIENGAADDPSSVVLRALP